MSNRAFNYCNPRIKASGKACASVSYHYGFQASPGSCCCDSKYKIELLGIYRSIYNDIQREAKFLRMRQTRDKRKKAFEAMDLP